MENVLVIACGATKNPTTGPVRALDLYAGRQFKLARRLEELGWTVLVMSAGYGLVEGNTLVTNYDRVIDPAYSRKAVAKVRGLGLSAFIFDNWTSEARRVVFYGGEQYFRIWEALVEVTEIARLDRGVDVTEIVGAGCGEHYSVLAEIVAEAEAQPVALAA